ncbi:Ig-like domain-containing protein [Actinopolymorpha alba]|uniref:Ig-like domain-containing protein n=1 Tax=Actinopolymorpha alba TaxID=533267 RepID=UPI0003801B12|nr:Ig-like domain-containing protein [Actinopolymorpha alba]
MTGTAQQEDQPQGMTRRNFVKSSALVSPAAMLVAGQVTPALAEPPGPTSKPLSKPLRKATALTGTIPAFPGAEGGGKYVTGGRGCEVYEVTNLNDSGPGSLRDAVSTDNRTVVFRVSGNIDINGGLDVLGSNITIAGQTAPGYGISVNQNEFQIKGDNVIVRYLRFRGGDPLGTPIDTFGFRGRNGVIIDHCSMSWGVDETCSPYGNTNVTIQWCIISEGLAQSVHDKGLHGFGGLWGGDNVTYHHNLLIHQGGRNPRFSFTEDMMLFVDHRNNIIYNHGYTSCYGGEWANGVHLRDNYYKPGPNTLSDIAPVIVAPGRLGQWYVDGNVVEGHPDVTADNRLGIEETVGGITLLSDPMKFPNEITAQSAQQAYESVLNNVGAILPRRDAVDARLINEVRTGTGRMINSQKEVGGWPPIPTAEPPVDTDHDGMPDDWEIAHKLDPANPADGSEVKGGNNGYTNLEVYLNSIGPAVSTGNPTVKVTRPRIDQVFATQNPTQEITIEAAAAADKGVNITKVEFYAGDQKLGESTAAPYSFVWPNAPAGTHFLTARATDSVGSSTTSSCVPVHVNATTAVTPWQARDIGNVPVPGAVSLVNNVFTVRGSGKIKGRSASFFYVYQPITVSSDDIVEIYVKIDSLSRVYEGNFAGVMLRENLTPDSPYFAAGIIIEGGSLKGHVSRIARYGNEVSISPYPWDDSLLSKKPYYIRVTKRGFELSAELSSDSLQWTRIGYERIDMPDKIHVGLAVDGNKQDNDVAYYSTAKFSQVRIRY